MSLYTDDNPNFTIKGTGFTDEKKAKESIKIVKEAFPNDKIAQMRIIHALYYRAKYHPHQTENMKKAMKVLKKWLDNYLSKK